VVTRKADAGREVLLVHRPKYDDWSFPKGKLDPGEHEVTAAVREVAEETGLDVRLGPALTPQRYPMASGRWKHVDYWTATVRGGDDVGGYRPNDEIDAVEWLPWKAARARLTYPHDRDTLAEARPLRRRTHALVVLRHGEAHPREDWGTDDRLRPLGRLGERQAERLVPLLAAFDVTAVHTSSSTRCVQTVQPYVDAAGWRPTLHDGLSEEDATVDGVVEIVDSLLDDSEGVVLCTHRPVLPTVIDALGVPDVALEPGAMLVVHRRKGRVAAIEVRQP
jgi:8-oxo-dGTP diphosphatase